MSPSSDLDRRISDWLDAQAPMREPDHLTYAVLARTRRTRQVPGWASLERWIPMTAITRPALSPPLRLAWLLLIAVLALTLATSVAIVGSRLLTSTAPDTDLPTTASIPVGDDAVFAFGSYSNGIAGGDIFTVRADGTDLRQLTSGPGVESNTEWSPDGTLIAYRLRQDGAESVAVMDAGGTNHSILATNDPIAQDCAPSWNLGWSPDGTSLIFPTKDGCSGPLDLAIVPADGSAPATRLVAEGTNSQFGVWSPDGTRIAYLGSEGTGRAGLYVVETSPGDAVSGGLEGRLIAPDLGPGLASESFGSFFSPPRWSPDGKELAVARVTDQLVLTGFVVVRADGSGQRLAVQDAGNPVWSPNGLQLAFHRTVDPSEYFTGRPCTVRTWIIEADGTDERRLEEIGDGCDFPVLWSPDGTRLASGLIASTAEDPNPGFHLAIVTIDGSSAPIILPDATPGSWQPVAAPLPPAPSFAPPSATP